MPRPIVSTELQEKAKKELNEEPNKIPENLEEIRKWLVEQPHLNCRTDEQWLINFLRVSKFNLDKTKRRIDLFHTYKTKIPEYFSERDPLLPEIQQVLNQRVIAVLPETTVPAGPRIVFIRGDRTNPDLFSVKNIIKALFMVYEVLCIEDPNFSIAGLFLIVDYQNTPYRYLTQITPGFMKKTLKCAQNAYPIRVKAFCFINVPPLFIIVYNLMKLFLNEKLKQRLYLYSNLEDAYNDIPRFVFPKDYGGEQPVCDEISDELKLKVESYRDWFLNGE